MVRHLSKEDKIKYRLNPGNALPFIKNMRSALMGFIILLTFHKNN